MQSRRFHSLCSSLSPTHRTTHLLHTTQTSHLIFFLKMLKIVANFSIFGNGSNDALSFNYFTITGPCVCLANFNSDGIDDAVWVNRQGKIFMSTLMSSYLKNYTCYTSIAFRLSILGCSEHQLDHRP